MYPIQTHYFFSIYIYILSLPGLSQEPSTARLLEDVWVTHCRNFDFQEDGGKTMGKPWILMDL
jgi:hypothetical protein